MNPIELAFSKLRRSYGTIRREPLIASLNASAAYPIASCHTNAQTSSMLRDINGHREIAPGFFEMV